MSKRVFLFVLDSFGIGEEPDAADFGDAGTSTIRSCATSKFFDMPVMHRLGLFDIDTVAEQVAEGICKRSSCDGDIMLAEATDVINGEIFSQIDDNAALKRGIYARLQEKSAGKDTTIGHWEIAGIYSENPLPTYPNGFPREVIEEFEKRTGRKTICNLPYSGTVVINEYGDEHVKTGALIVYTSADSVFQIAAHEDVVPVEQLYEYCKIAREILKGQHGVGRVIARPFVGTSGNYTRTSRRHDFSLEPPALTMLDQLKEAGYATLAVGKIKDIFVGKGISEFVYTTGNTDGLKKSLEYADKDFEGLCFINLVDYDMLYGHRRDKDGYAQALKEFDEFLPGFLEKLGAEDVVMITADHGCDPGYTKTTDHTREYVPLIVCGQGSEIMKQGARDNEGGINLGTRASFADIGATVLKYFGVEQRITGTPIY